MGSMECYSAKRLLAVLFVFLPSSPTKFCYRQRGVTRDYFKIGVDCKLKTTAIKLHNVTSSINEK